MATFLPPWLIRRTKPCARCGLRHPEGETECPHCAELSDAEVSHMQRRRAQEDEANARLGSAMSIGAALLGVLVVIFALM